MPSPILPCGCLCPIPIPYRVGIPYSDIYFGKHPLARICAELKPKWTDGEAHLDPDLYSGALKTRRPNSWRALFGQSGVAASHLFKQEVGNGALFLFFGWFRHAIVDNGRLWFSPKDPHGRHIVYGWLQVGTVIEALPLSPELSFAAYHPHVQFFREETGPNIIFVAAKGGLGAGLFNRAEEALVLTHSGQSRSKWLLDSAFKSVCQKRELTYHHNPKRWKLCRDGVALQSVSRGQEFVLDGDRHPEVEQYVRDLVVKARRNTSTCQHPIW
jgi:hypothetical protein